MPIAAKYQESLLNTLLDLSESPHVAHLGYAAFYTKTFLKLNHICSAFCGGWAVFLRGSGRVPKSLALVVRCPMEKLLLKISCDSRFIVPEEFSPTEHQMITFVKTCGPFNPPFTEKEKYIKVHLIEWTWYGLPSHSTERIIPTATTAGTHRVRVVNIFHTVRVKLADFMKHRYYTDYMDLVFLVRHYCGFVVFDKDPWDREAAQYFCDAFVEENRYNYERICEVEKALRLLADDRAQASQDPNTDGDADGESNGESNASLQGHTTGEE